MKMKICAFVILLAAGVTSSRAQDTWIQKADFGGTPRYGAVGFSIGAKGYIGTGYNGTYLKDFWEYDPATDAWTQKANFGGTARYWATGFSIGSKGYVGTGVGSSGFRNDFLEYDAASNTWTQKANFGGTARMLAVGFSIGSEGYIGTGYDSNYEKDFWEYDPATDVWTQKANFGGAGRQGAVGFSSGSKGYVGTGFSNFGSFHYYSDFWEYDPTANSWIEKADFRGTARDWATGFSIGSKGYIGTGHFYDGNDHYYKDFFEYDAASNTWTQKADFGGTGKAEAVGFSMGSKGYIGTGFDGSYTNDFWEYTPEETSIAIDIKPGTFPNSINPRSKGVIPVAILTTDTFDATAVDQTTVRFGPNGTEAAPVQSALEDVDGDGDTDMILHFKTQDTGIVCGDTSASITGETFGGQAIEGSDSFKTVGCK